jgi:hypothetical protein
MMDESAVLDIHMNVAVNKLRKINKLHIMVSLHPVSTVQELEGTIE